MTPTQEYQKRTREELTKRFARHVADIRMAGNTLVVYWQEPGTWNHGMIFIVHRQWLTVLGDLGEFVFQWSSDISLAFLSDLSFDYFMEKCRASPRGDRDRVFDARVLRENLKNEAEVLEGLKKCNRERLNDPVDGADEWKAVVHDVYDSDPACDCELASMLCDMGMVYSFHAIACHVGIEMAAKQIIERSEPKAETCKT